MTARRGTLLGSHSPFGFRHFSFLAPAAGRLYTSISMKRFAILILTLLSAVALRAQDPATFEVGGLTFDRPADWSWVPVSSPMRKAQLKIPGVKPEESADITFFYFGEGGGGDVQSNAQRWVSQFRGPEGAAKIEEQKIGGLKVTTVSTEGTFSSGMPGGPTTALDNYALLGAIVEGKEGNVFVKMTGPIDLVKQSRKKFLAFLTAAIEARK
jgi:hypothetical protein